MVIARCSKRLKNKSVKNPDVNAAQWQDNSIAKTRMSVFHNTTDCVTGSEVSDQHILDEALAILTNGESAAVEEKPAAESETVSDAAVSKSASSPAELLDWCIDMTRGYQGIKLTNWTTSWRNGLAFCAIISHFRPDLIDYNALSARDIHANNKLAFDVAEQLGVARLLNADDMQLLVVPDKLNVMTFVYQLRAQLTGCSVPTLHSPSPTSSLPHDADRPNLLPTSSDWLSNLCPLTAIERQAVDAKYAASLHAEGRSLAHTVKQLLSCVAQSSDIATSPSDHLPRPPTNSVNSTALMTRQQLLNPFDSDSDSEAKSAACSLADDACKQQLSLSKDSTLAQTTDKASPANLMQPETVDSDAGNDSEQLADSAGGDSCTGATDTATAPRRQYSRREQLRERARLLLEQARRDAVTSPTLPVVDNEDERQRRLRERARKLIAESRANAASGSSVTQVITVHSRKPIGQSVGVPTGEMYGFEDVPLQRRPDVSQLTTADQHCNSPSSASYAEVEIEFLERSLARLDERAAGVEWSLRRIMDSQRNSDEDAQQRLMYEWFALVDERGELVRRIEQLNAVAQEQDLERRFELLSVELRRLMAECEANDKDKESADRECLLLAELMSIVNQRDALVQQLDKQEQEIAVRSTPVVEARKSSSQDSGCSLQ